MLVTDQASILMLARPHIKHLDVGHIILLRNSHTFFIARPDTILGSCPVSPTSTIPGSQRRNNHISFFPSIKARGTTTIPFLCDARFLPINLGAILFTGKKVHVPKSLSLLSPTSLPCNPLPCLGAAGAERHCSDVRAPGAKVWRLSCRLYTLDFRSSCWRLDKTGDAVLAVVIARFSQYV